MNHSYPGSPSPAKRRPLLPSRGFSLLEFLIAMAIFAIISGATVSLFRRHMPLYAQQQDLTGLNIQLRSAVSQLQLDLANAGTGVFPGVNIAHWPIGVTVKNNLSGGNCYDAATRTYSAACFDELHVVAADPDVPPVHPEDIAANCVSTTSSTAFAQAASGFTLAQTAALFHNGDTLLFVKGDGSQMTTVSLTSGGAVSGGKVQLQHNPTGVGGLNPGDALGISSNPSDKLGDTFCNTDWIFKLLPISYRIDTADPSAPVLVRVVNGIPDAVAGQIIGFKVGVTLWNGLTTSSAEYNFDAASYDYDFTLIRSVRVSLIARTRPNYDPGYTFRNAFDGGPYQIQGLSVVVNPRNLSMND